MSTTSATVDDNQRHRFRYHRVDAHRLVGVTYRQVDYWNRIGVWRTEETATGSGSRPTASFEEMLDLAVIAAVMPFRKSLPDPDTIRQATTEGGVWVIDGAGGWRRSLGGGGLAAFCAVVVDVDEVARRLRARIDDWVQHGGRVGRGGPRSAEVLVG